MFSKLETAKIIILAIALFCLSTNSASAAPSDFSLYWSCDSYVPFEYEGKALPSQGSRITVYVAPAQKTAVDPDALYYVWLLDGDPMGWANGAGKSSFTFASTKKANSYHEIESQIYDQKGGDLLWRKFLSIKIARPEILVREEKGNYSNQYVGAEPDKEVKLEAAPLFFKIKSASDLSFSWQIENEEILTDSQEEPNKLSLKIPAGDISEPILKKISISSWLKNNSLIRAFSQLTLDIR